MSLSTTYRAISHIMQHGHQLQRRCHISRRQQDDDWSVHRKPSHGQTHTSSRHHLVLQIRLGSRHTGSGRHCPIPPGHVRHHQRRAPDYTDGSSAVPRTLLLQQRPTLVSALNAHEEHLLTVPQCRTDHCRMGPPPRWPSLFDPPRRLPSQAIICDWRFRINLHLRLLRRKLEGEHE